MIGNLRWSGMPSTACLVFSAVCAFVLKRTSCATCFDAKSEVVTDRRGRGYLGLPNNAKESRSECSGLQKRVNARASKTSNSGCHYGRVSDIWFLPIEKREALVSCQQWLGSCKRTPTQPRLGWKRNRKPDWRQRDARLDFALHRLQWREVAQKTMSTSVGVLPTSLQSVPAACSWGSAARFTPNPPSTPQSWTPPAGSAYLPFGCDDEWKLERSASSTCSKQLRRMSWNDMMKKGDSPATCGLSANQENAELWKLAITNH